MHKRFWMLRLDAASMRTWGKQLRTAAARMPRLAHALLQQQQAGMERFTALYRQLRALPRTLRRQLQRQWACSLAGVALLLTVQPQALWAANFSASNESELTTAITTANTNGEADTITLEQDITLTSELPIVTSKITIAGGGHTIERDGSDQTPYFRILEVNALGDLTIENTIISGGSTPERRGGGIFNRGSLTLIDSTVTNNQASYCGGGIANFASEGGTASATLTNSTVSGNYADLGGAGGGICNYATADTSTAILTLTNSTVSGNDADSGGGIANVAYSGATSTTTLNNCTVSDNGAAYGGGIYNYAFGDPSSAVVNLNRSLISGNNAGEVGDEVVEFQFGGGVATTNADSLNLFGHGGISNSSAFYNFTPGATDINATSDGTNVAIASILAALASNGGPTETHALVAASPAINGADTCGLATDQRGTARSDGDCDIGSYEFDTKPPDTGDPCDNPDLSPSEDCIVNRVPHQRCIGTDGDDVIIAPKREGNVILGLGGHDILRGQQGDDILCGGDGDDTLIGALGDDILSGGEGNDMLRGNDGNDTLFGGAGDDLLVGWRGNDRLIGGPGNDHLLGGTGDDYLDGGADRDVLNGGPDTDTCLEGEKLLGCP
ncbi:MAG: hypothetical protein HYZ50_18205 [Deltaproteobacteria bacterium]|nr:hypothetical protein [Deltaproteobacteria bacterium]